MNTHTQQILIFGRFKYRGDILKSKQNKMLLREIKGMNLLRNLLYILNEVAAML